MGAKGQWWLLQENREGVWVTVSEFRTRLPASAEATRKHHANERTSNAVRVVPKPTSEMEA